MPEVSSIDGYLHSVRFVFPRVGGDRTVYLSGSFNCNGQGSTYFMEEHNWVCTITLPPGRYDYRILVNQYHSFDESRNPVTENTLFEIPLETTYHNPGMPQFAGNIGGHSIVRLAVPRGGGNYVLETESGSGIYREEVAESFGTVYEFGGDFRKYRFSGDKISIPRTGYFTMVPEERKSERRTLMYQIFPDRFNRGSRPSKELAPWGSQPTASTYFGGDLKGISSKLEYLKSLGVSHLYLNPINSGGSNHRYDVLDYFSIDPLLGNEDDFRNLVRTAHSMGIRVIMDVVFNHTSVDHPFFRDAVSRKMESPYFHWYRFIDDNPEIYRHHYTPGESHDAPGYETFLGYGGMPKVNLMEKEAREYFNRVIAHYVEDFKVDGFRFDVADSIPVDYFKELFHIIGSYDREIGKICEAWCVAPYFTREGLFDGLMNYPLRSMILSMVGMEDDFNRFRVKYRELCFQYGDRPMTLMMNLLGSHDVSRLRNVLGEDEDKFRLSYAILYMMNGLPSLYYGDEACLTGGPDPDCRRCFPWNSLDSSSLGFFRNLGKTRQLYTAMEEGITMFRDYGDCFGIAKMDHHSSLEMVFTTSHEASLSVTGKILVANGITVNGGAIDMGPFSFVIFERSGSNMSCK
ncbi:MAG: alpha-amylase family glycosyl hydrolase [Candidatus Thermoplasmatota archaeon]|nr:alpha-amylase family glycosyl hydrolase [Candidatus Thermoplasmatota archaeon]MCL5438323.1 alpha-amylase family glycosyl hydrolase [Candidatus Thermoplasmatota archaeon]